MKIQAFVCTWVGHEQQALALEETLRPLVEVQVINSEAAVAARHPTWHPTADYFTNHWNKALDLFDADILFLIQADASCPQFDGLLQRCRWAIEQMGCGVYAPNVDYNPWVFDRARLRPVADDLFEVPQTDCICWAVSRDVLEAMPRIDPGVNQFGWGIDWLVLAVARKLGKQTVRDYRYTVTHPRGTGYNRWRAEWQMRAMLRRLPAELRSDVRVLQEEVLGGPPPPLYGVLLWFVWDALRRTGQRLVGKMLRRPT